MSLSKLLKILEIVIAARLITQVDSAKVKAIVKILKLILDEAEEATEEKAA